MKGVVAGPQVQTLAKVTVSLLYYLGFMSQAFICHLYSVFDSESPRVKFPRVPTSQAPTAGSLNGHPNPDAVTVIT